MSDYKDKTIKEDSVVWYWKSIKEIEKDPAVIKAYEFFLQFRKIKQVESMAKIIWAASNDGKYSVKSGYNTLINFEKWEKMDIPLNLCWDTSCLPKAGLFLWLAFQGKILTADKLQKIVIGFRTMYYAWW